jgi:hypothetical protein
MDLSPFGPGRGSIANCCKYSTKRAGFMKVEKYVDGATEQTSCVIAQF